MATADFDSIYSSITDTYKSFQKALEKKQEEYLSKGYKLTKDGNVDMRGTANNPEVEKYKKETQAFFDKYREYLKEINEIQNENYESNLEQEEELFNIQKQHDIYKKLAEQQRSKTALDNAKKEYNARVLSNNKEYQDLVKQELDIFDLSKANNKELTDEQIGNLAEIRKKRLDIENEINKKTADNLTNQVTESVNKWTEKGKTAGESIIKHISEAFNKYSNYMLFDQLQSGVNDLSNAYEQNFTSIAGYSGSDSRDANHEFIKGVLEEVNANDYTKYGLNFNKEVFPEITNAVKEGFMGEEAQEIAISNAIDKKIMPWLDTSSETWTNMQFNLSDERIQSIKGQQLLLQETREGNRLLQDGVVSALLDTMQPTLLNIDANTTSFEDLSAEAQATVAYLMQKGYGKQDAIKIANQAIDAYQNPAEALMNNGSPIEMLMGMTSLNGGDLGDIIDTYGDVASMGKGMDAVGRQAMVNIMGVNSGNWTRTSSTFDALAGLGKEEYNKMLELFLIDSEAARRLYLSKESNLAENVTATQAHDNNIQNATAETVFDWNNTAHGMDTVSLILDEVIAIKQWLIKSAGDKLAESFGNFLGNFLGNKAGGRNTSSIVDSVTNLTKSSKLGKLAGFNSSGMGIALNTGVALAGTALTYKGIKDYKENDQIVKDDSATQYDKDAAGVKRGLSAATAGLGATAAVAGGTAAVTGALGVGGTLGAIGAAAGPVGWAALGLGAIALGAKKIYDITTDIGGAADQIKEEYDQQRDAIMSSTRTNISTLTGILGELQSGVLDEEELQEKRNELIQSGILSQADEEKARTANQEQLEELTKSYANAAKEFNKEIARDFNKYNVETQAWSNDMWGGLEKGLQAFNDGYDPLHGIYRTEDFNKVANEVFTHVYTDLENKDYSSLDKESQKTLDNLKEFFENGSLDESEVNKIVDEGFFDSVLQSTDVSPETVELIYTVLKDMASTNEAAKVIVEDYMKTDHKYYDPEETTKALELLNKAQTATNTDSAIEYLEEFKQAGYKLSDYSDQKSELSTKWGTSIDLKGYKSGTSFVPYDNMIAELHYGERVLTNPENKEYTENQLSGNNGISTIQIGLQDIVSAIQQQTSDIITYLQSMNSMSSMNGLSNLNMSATMGATRVVV